MTSWLPARVPKWVLRGKSELWETHCDIETHTHANTHAHTHGTHHGTHAP